MDKQRFILTPKQREPEKKEPRKNRHVSYTLMVCLWICIAVAVGGFIVKSLTQADKKDLRFPIDGEKSFFEATLGDQIITM